MSVSAADALSDPAPTRTTLDLYVQAIALNEPDRSLNRAVMIKFGGWHRVQPRFAGNRHGAYIAPQDWIGRHSDGSPILDSLHGTDLHRDVPELTSSTDVGIALCERLELDSPKILAEASQLAGELARMRGGRFGKWLPIALTAVILATQCR